jgi:hypothetical protein
MLNHVQRKEMGKLLANPAIYSQKPHELHIRET